MEFLQTILSICGGISIIGGAIGILYNAYNQTNKPKKDIENRLQAIENDVSEIKRKLEKDYMQISENREDMNLIMRSMLNLIENKLTNNNIDGLKKTRDELINALTEN